MLLGWKQGGNRLLVHRTILQQQGLIGEHACVQCLLDVNEGSHSYPYIFEGSVGDLDHCRQLVPNEVAAETGCLNFDVVVCCSR